MMKRQPVGMRMSPRCEMCDVAWELGLSEQEFLERFDNWQRDQLMATYRSRGKRAYVMSAFPIRRRKGKE